MNGIHRCPRKIRRTAASAALACMLGCVLVVAASAEEKEMTLQEALEAVETFEQETEAVGGEELVYDELGRVTPRKSIVGLAAAWIAGDFERAARYHDLSRLPADAPEGMGATLAWQMRRILPQVYGTAALWDMTNSLGSSPEGRVDDGLPPQFERLARIPSRTGEADFLLERVPREDGELIWKVSARTVGQIPRLWEEYGYWGLEERLSPFFFRVPLPHLIQPWQWMGLLLLGAVGALAGWLLSRGIRRGLLGTRSSLGRDLSRFVPGPIGLLAALWIFTTGTSYLRLAVTSQTYVTAGERLVLVVALTWIAVRVADTLLETLRRRLLRRRETSLTTVALPTLRRLAQILIVTVALILFFDSLGFNVTALVAGLGVGGLAVALAAQRTIENFIGALTLYADQPVRVGDLCRFGEHLGTIEAIGLRSTRIRTFDRTIVSVPNAEFANLHLHNFARRDKMWFHPKISLRYETTPDQLRCVLVEIRRLLYGHPRVENEGARIRFKGFGDFSLDLEIFAYILATEYADYLEVAEDLNLRIIDIVAVAGTSFAFPSQTTYLEQGAPLEPEAAESAKERVRDWREKSELFLPSFPRETIETLRGSVEYPPMGSPHGPKAPPAGARGEQRREPDHTPGG